jgi:DNA-binding NarL/FixJ family response regulator
MRKGKIRIFVADEHLIIREALTRVLADEPDLLVVGGRGSVAGALAEVAESRPDLVLMELQFPDGDGFDLLRRLREAVPETRRLVLSAFSDEFRVSEAPMATF